jgi:chromosome segregation ATPase
MKYLLLLPFIFLFACSSDTETVQSQQVTINDLRTKISQDSVLLASLNSEMSAINDALDTAQSLNQSFQDGNKVGRAEALDKIQNMNKLLNESNEKVIKLERRLKTTNLANNSAVTMPITTAKNQIQVNKKFFEQLQRDVESLKSENVSLKEIIKQKEGELIAKDDIINSVKKEREEQERRLGEVSAKLTEVEARIANAEQEVASTKRESKNQKALLYYETGVELKLMFDDIDKKMIEIGTGKAKKELAKQAYSCFKKSYALGYPSAQSQVLEMESTKKYSKHL